MKDLFNRIIEMFEEPSSGFSMVRVIMFLQVAGYLTWASFIVYKTHVIPDIPLQLAGSLTLLYGINKFSPSKDK